MIVLLTARKRRDGEPVSETHVLISGPAEYLDPDSFVEVIGYADSNLKDLEDVKKYSCPKFVSEVLDVLLENSVSRFESVYVAEDPDNEARRFIDCTYEVEMDSKTLSCEVFVDGICVDDEYFGPAEASAIDSIARDSDRAVE